MAHRDWQRFNQTEQRMLRGLTTPARIQRFLDHEIGYNLEPQGDTCYSPRMVLRHKVAQCMEGALLGAAALRLLGHQPLLVDLEAVRDTDHVLAVYRAKGRWGAIAKSDYSGLRSREPVYRTVRELAMSYFEHYFNLKGEKTLRSYSRPVSLKRFDRMNWMTEERDVWEIPNHLCEISHTRILAPGMERSLSRMDERLYKAGRTAGRTIAKNAGQRGGRQKSSAPLKQYHARRNAHIQRGHAARHGNPNQEIALLGDMFVQPLALSPQHDRRGTCVIDLIVGFLAAFVQTIDPVAALFQLIQGPVDVGHSYHRKISQSAGRGLCSGLREGRRSSLRNHNRGRAGGVCRSDDRPQVVRILHAVQHHVQTVLRGRLLQTGVLFGSAERNHALMDGSSGCTVEVLAWLIMNHNLSLPAEFDQLLHACSARAFGDYDTVQR